MSSSNEKLKIGDNHDLSDTSKIAKQNDANIKSEKSSLIADNLLAESKSNRNSKLNDLHYTCLRKYLKEDILIGYTEAMEKLQEETDIKCSYSTIRKVMLKLRDEIYANSTSLEHSEFKNKSFKSHSKLKDFHMEYLKKYLRENIRIGNTEAMNRLYQDTGLKISVTPVRLALINLEEEIRKEAVISSSESELKDDVKPRIQGGKLQNLHIECLKKYLNENASIGYYKAKTKLKNDTGLELTTYEVQKSIYNIKNSANQDNIETQLSSLKVRCRKKAFGFKIKDLDIEYLKKYLKEDSSIGPSNARNRLYKDTGLEVTIPAIHTTLVELKEENNYLKDSYISSTSNSGNKTKPWNYGRKLKNNHIECLKKYLKDDFSIGVTKAKNRLHEETGLQISVFPVQKALIKLRKEFEQENIDPFSKSDYKTVNKTRNCNYSLEDHHIELLKIYLKDNGFIGYNEARVRLKEETGFETTTTTVKTTMIKLRKEMGLNVSSRPYAARKSSTRRLKLKDLHLQYLRKYLKEDILISSTEAMKKLQEETGLKCSNLTVRRRLENLKKEMNPDYASLISVSASRNASTTPKLKDSHLKFLKNILIEDPLIGPTEAKNRLHEETGLAFSISIIFKTLVKFRKELSLDYSNLDPSAVKNRRSNDHSKLKDSHLKSLKNILIEDPLIRLNEAKNLLHEETGLTCSISTIFQALKKLRKELDLNLSEIKNRRLSDHSKLKDSHLKFLKNILIENPLIGFTEARNRLHEDTGLTCSFSTISNTLKKLRKELDLDLSEIKNRRSNNYSRLKDSHLKFLKNILIEDPLIGPTEAKNRLHEETGLTSSLTTISRTLIKFRKELSLDYSNLDPSAVKNRRSNDHSKLKDSHLKSLKNILIEDPLIRPNEAKNLLHEETGLTCSISTILQALKKLRKELDLDLSEIKNRRLSGHSELKDSHLKFLKNILIENPLIGFTEARNRLHEDTGLTCSFSTISNTLKKLRKELDLDLSEIKNRRLSGHSELKDSHLKFLKNILIEDPLIGPTEARNRLHEETDLTSSLKTISRTLIKFRKELSLDYSNLDPSAVKNRRSNYRSRLKDPHLKFLKNILIEDPLIGPTEARKRLKEEFSLDVSYYFVRTTLIEMKKKLASE